MEERRLRTDPHADSGLRPMPPAASPGTLSSMSQQTFTTILPTLAVGWLMVVAGLGKRKLDLRPPACRNCGRRFCHCSSRR